MGYVPLMCGQFNHTSTHVPFGESVSASFHSFYVTRRRWQFAVAVPSELPLALLRLEAARFRYVRGLRSTGFITYFQCDRGEAPFYVGTVERNPLRERVFRSPLLKHLLSHT